MDAVKINSLTYVPAARPADAASALAARTEAALAGVNLIESLLDADLGASGVPVRADAASARLPLPLPTDRGTAPMPGRTPDTAPPPLAASLPLPLPAPTAGVIVSLSAGLLARALEMHPAPGALPPLLAPTHPKDPALPTGVTPAAVAPALVAADYNHLKPGLMPLPAAQGEVTPPRAPGAPNPSREPAEIMRSAMVASAAVMVQTASDSSAQPSLSAAIAGSEPRADVYPQSGQLMAAMQSVSVSAAEQKPAASAIAQARDAERLAGLALRPEVPVVPPQHKFSKLVLGAVILGALLLMFL